MSNIPIPRLLLLVLASASLLIAGSSCSQQTSQPEELPQETIKSSRTPSLDQPDTTTNEMRSMDVPTADAAQPEWTAAADWRQLPADGIRRATWSIPGPDGSNAELSVTVFPGDVGGLPANIARWQRQLGLPQEATGGMGVTEQLSGSQLPITVVVLDGENGQSMRVGVLPDQGRTWFFKMMGDSSAVQSQDTAFREFLRSVRL